jgi:hypothetical protein
VLSSDRLASSVRRDLQNDETKGALQQSHGASVVLINHAVSTRNQNNQDTLKPQSVYSQRHFSIRNHEQRHVRALLFAVVVAVMDYVSGICFLLIAAIEMSLLGMQRAVASCCLNRAGR